MIASSAPFHPSPYMSVIWTVSKLSPIPQGLDEEIGGGQMPRVPKFLRVVVPASKERLLYPRRRIKTLTRSFLSDTSNPLTVTPSTRKTIVKLRSVYLHVAAGVGEGVGETVGEGVAGTVHT